MKPVMGTRLDRVVTKSLLEQEEAAVDGEGAERGDINMLRMLNWIVVGKEHFVSDWYWMNWCREEAAL